MHKDKFDKAVKVRKADAENERIYMQTPSVQLEHQEQETDLTAGLCSCQQISREVWKL